MSANCGAWLVSAFIKGRHLSLQGWESRTMELVRNFLFVTTNYSHRRIQFYNFTRTTAQSNEYKAKKFYSATRFEKFVKSGHFTKSFFRHGEKKTYFRKQLKRKQNHVASSTPLLQPSCWEKSCVFIDYFKET